MKLVVVVVCVGVGVLLSLQGRRVVDVHLSWGVRVAEAGDAHPGFPTPLAQPWARPPPVCFLGSSVVVAAHNGPRLLRLQSDGASLDPDDEHSAPAVVAEASLLEGLRVVAGRRPVALGVGHGLVCALTEDWGVACFDEELRRVWGTTASHLADRYADSGHAFHKEASVAVTALPDGSVAVVVAGSLQHVHAAVRVLGGAEEEEAADVGGGDEAREDADEDTLAAERHFSFYAFDGGDGSLLWKHEGVDMPEEVGGGDLTQPQHRYAIHVSNAHHASNAASTTGSWRRYRRSVLQQLPHTWGDRDHTRLSFAEFEAVRPGRRVESWTDAAAAPTAGAVTSVVVAHTSSGVEAVDMGSGEPVAHLSLPPGGVFVDIDGDGVLDVVEAVSPRAATAGVYHVPESRARLLPHCHLRVKTGVPATAVLWNVTACGSRQGSKGSLLPPPPARKRKGETVFSAGTSGLDVDMGLPVVVRHGKLGTGADTYAVLVHVSSGWVSAYDSTGGELWQTRTPAGWESRVHPYSPTLFPFAPDGKAHPTMGDAHMLVVGANSLAVLRLSDGKLLARRVFPEDDLPVGAPSFGDFDGDGLADFVILAASGKLLGFVLRHQEGSWFVMVVIGFFVVIMTGASVAMGVLPTGVPSKRPRPSPRAATPAAKALRRKVVSPPSAGGWAASPE